MWIALFSNSGNEIAAISQKIGKKPDMIYCDKQRVGWHPYIEKNVYLSSHDSIMNLLSNRSDDTLITLHGYLRLIPPNSITTEMYNVHPGDIVKYPELKGIHPQAKALELGLPTTGVVIHKVVEDVDSGEIVSSAGYEIKEDETEASLINNLRDLSVDLWCEFLRSKL